MKYTLPITKEQNMKYADALHIWFEGRKRGVKVSGDWIGDVFKFNIQDHEFFTARDACKFLDSVFQTFQQPAEEVEVELEVAA